MKQLSWLSLSELKHVLLELKSYADMQKKLWKRGVHLFHNTLLWRKTFKVEHHSSLTDEDAYLQSLEVFQKVFWEKPKREDIIFQVRESLKWGMRVFMDDSMIDMSYMKVTSLLQR